MSARKRHRKNRSRTIKSRSLRYDSLTARQKSTYEKSVALLFDLRTGKGTYAQLLRKHHLGSRTARKYLGRNLLRGANGRVRASKADRLVRQLLFPMPFGDLPITTRNSKEASRLSEFFNDRDKLLRGKLGVHEFETKWRGVRVAGQELFADASSIFRMQNAGVLKMENLYAGTSNAR
jgi:hypothetical protein